MVPALVLYRSHRRRLSHMRIACYQTEVRGQYRPLMCVGVDRGGSVVAPGGVEGKETRCQGHDIARRTGLLLSEI